ncbi:MAG: TRAP transporter small permease [Lautropia sp.]
MAEPSGAGPARPRGAIASIAEAFAALGGVALLGVTGVTLVSVIGGAVFGKPLLGDTEIVELLIGAAVACFMPYCQVRGAHVVVDFFTMKASARVKHTLDGVMLLIAAIVVALLAERLVQGTIDQYTRERVSMFLRLPQWWGYAVAAAATVAWAVVTLHAALRSLLRGRRR